MGAVGQTAGETTPVLEIKSVSYRYVGGKFLISLILSDGSRTAYTIRTEAYMRAVSRKQQLINEHLAEVLRDVAG